MISTGPGSFLFKLCATVSILIIALGSYKISPTAAAARGGPLAVGGPTLGISGQPFIWDPAAMPIQYRVDPGPMAINPSGAVVVDNATALARLSSMFSTWANVSTASVSFSNSGSLLASGAYTGGPVANGSSTLA